MNNIGELSIRRHWEIKDGKVFSGGSVLKNADASSFEVLNYLYARDCNQAYYSFGTIKDADASSFKALDSGAVFNRTGRFLLNFIGYACDEKNVYHYHLTVGKPSIVRNADSKTFQSLNGVFGHDSKSVFLYHTIIKYAQVKSWTFLQGSYSCDDDFCFYGNKRIVGADRVTFICLPSSFGLWAKDQHHFYHCGQRSSEKQYFVEFDTMVNSLERTKQSLLEGRL